jgi:hypothetical protein
VADLKIDADDIQADNLPAICVVTGERNGVHGYPVTLRWVPSFLYLGLIFCGPGIVLFLLLGFVRRNATGTLPFTHEAYQRFRRSEIAKLIFAGVVIVLVPLGFLHRGFFILALPFGLLAALSSHIWKGPRCISIDGERLVELELPSTVAVHEIKKRLAGTNPPPGAVCAVHPELRAIGMCVRCEKPGCAPCLKRKRPAAARRCARCTRH